MPIGKPLLLNPQGTEIDGSPVPLPTAPIMSLLDPNAVRQNSSFIGVAIYCLEGPTMASKADIVSSTALAITPLNLKARM